MDGNHRHLHKIGGRPLYGCVDGHPPGKLSLVPVTAFGPDADGRIRSPYGKALSETITTMTLFSDGEMITVVKDDEVIFNKFYPRYIPNGEKSKERNE